MGPVILLFAFFSLCSDPSAATSFEMVFQNSPHSFKNDFAEFKGPIPNLTEFTSCHWEKLSYLAARSNTIWSYCYHERVDRPSLNCIQLYSMGDLASYDMNMIYSLWVAGLGDKNLDIQVKVDPYLHRAWNHVCVVYSSVNKSTSIYFNGQLSATKVDESLPGIRGTESVHEYAFILGQEPDSMRGSFSSEQAFYGRISELNIWDEPIKDGVITKMAAGIRFGEGNVVSWRRESFESGNILVNEIQDETSYFQTKKKYMIFPQKLSKDEAKQICSAHGGSIVIPNSDKETRDVQNVLLKHEDTCSDRNRFDLYNMPGSWLGLEKPGNTWIKIHGDKIRLFNNTYSNWRNNNWKVAFEGMCSRIQTNGKWIADTKNACDKFRLCTVCEFLNTPVFSIKGLCSKVSPLQWNYYPIINDSYQIDTYEGYKRYQSISLNGNDWKNDYKGEMFMIRNVEYPIGRSEWDWFEKSCTNEVQKKNLTFSYCKLGTQFTCDSGSCIAVTRRCDDVVDCADESDEYDCIDVDIPYQYDELNPPKLNKNETMHVNLKIIIKNINEIITERMMIDSSLEVTMNWTDSRLMYKNLPSAGGHKLIKNEVSTKLWLPVDTLIYDNAIVGELIPDSNMQVTLITNSVPLPIDIFQHREEFRHEGSDTTIQITKTFRVKTTCNFDFTKFPFDEHECSILMHIKDFRNTKVDLFGTNRSIHYIGGPIVGQFDVASSPYPYIENNPCPRNCSSNSDLKIILKLKRRSINGIIQIITPSLILWLCAILTMQYDVNDLTNRNRTSVTALLVLVMLFGSISNKGDFPKTSGFKHIDVWFVWYLINVFLIMCHHTAISKISKNPKTKIGAKNKHTSCIMYGNMRDSAVLESVVKRKEMINRIMTIFLILLTILFNVIYVLFAMI